MPVEYLLRVPHENIATYEFGGGRPDRAVAATVPGMMAGPFEVVAVVRDGQVTALSPFGPWLAEGLACATCEKGRALPGDPEPGQRLSP